MVIQLRFYLVLSCYFYMTNKIKNLAPSLVRQRLIIEGTTKKIVEPYQIKAYLEELAKVTQMEALSKPFVYSAHDKGYGAWIHWKFSGATFYSYPEIPPLFTIDTYTCKPFSVKETIEFTKKYFKPREMIWKEVGIAEFERDLEKGYYSKKLKGGKIK